MQVEACPTSCLAASAERRLRGRKQTGMASMQQSLLLSTEDFMKTQRAKQEAFPTRGLTFASSSSFRRRWIWILRRVGTFLMPCNSTGAALQLTSIDGGRLGDNLTPAPEGCVLPHRAVAKGAGCSTSEGYPAVKCLARDASHAAPHACLQRCPCTSLPRVP